MLFVKKVKKARGIELINEIAGRFVEMTEELDQGIVDCRDEQSCIRITIKQLKERNATLEASAVQAAKI